MDPEMTQMLTYIGEPRIDEAKDKFIRVEDPDTRGYYVQRLDVYEKLLSNTDYWHDSEREFYRYFATHWRLMIINYYIDLDLMRLHTNFDWLNWRFENPVDETWNEWRDRHRVVDMVTD